MEMNILLGATASSGVIELPNYIATLKKELNAEIRVVATLNVENFISLNLLRSFSQSIIYTNMYDGADLNTPHSDLLDWADIFLVLPCTANTLSKSANGIADNLLSLLILCSTNPVHFFPNMNPKMWSSKIIQYNASKLVKLGHKVIVPNGNTVITATKKELDSGHMPSPLDVTQYLKNYFCEVTKN
ncbi:hypothetical protein COL07_28895 [Bacillus cereus]|nr:hypothetical protein COL07_28895 [Bacillus cereus]